MNGNLNPLYGLNGNLSWTLKLNYHTFQFPLYFKENTAKFIELSSTKKLRFFSEGISRVRIEFNNEIEKDDCHKYWIERLMNLNSLGNLKEVILINIMLADVDLELFYTNRDNYNNRKLQTLHIENCNVLTARTITEINKRPDGNFDSKLKKLVLLDNFEIESYEFLSQLDALESLTLYSRCASAKIDLRKCTKLRYLSLTNCVDIEFGEMPNLRSLTFERIRNPITAQMLSQWIMVNDFICLIVYTINDCSSVLCSTDIMEKLSKSSPMATPKIRKILGDGDERIFGRNLNNSLELIV